jgi:hypothetical protein
VFRGYKIGCGFAALGLILDIHCRPKDYWIAGLSVIQWDDCDYFPKKLYLPIAG